MSIKYKIFFAIGAVVTMVCAGLFYFVQDIVVRDKLLLIRELNLSQIDSAAASAREEISERARLLRDLLGRGLSSGSGSIGQDQEFVIGVSVYQRSELGKWSLASRIANPGALLANGIPPEVLATIDRRHPPDFDRLSASDDLKLVNRSISLSDGSPLPVFGWPFRVSTRGSKDVRLAIVDTLQDPVRQHLVRSGVADLFLVDGVGKLLSHSDARAIVDHAGTLFPHPVVRSLGSEYRSKVSKELAYSGRDYLVEVGELGIGDLFLVLQVDRDRALASLREIRVRGAQLALLVLVVAGWASMLFAGKLSLALRRLTTAAEMIGEGQFDAVIETRGKDEAGELGRTLKFTTGKIRQLLSVAQEKGRMEQELKTAQLMQRLVLAPPRLAHPALEVDTYYAPLHECGGDFWGGWIQNDRLTLFIGDATGHGASAAIATAVAKGCLETLTALYGDSELSSAQLNNALNTIVCRTCKGELLITLLTINLDLRSGWLEVSAAGHERPLRISGKLDVSSQLHDVQTFEVTGERIGYSEETAYEAATFQLDPNDTLVLFTDGISEAMNGKNREFGTARLKRAARAVAEEPVARIRQTLIGAMRQHVGNAPITDDITLLLVRWLGPNNQG